MIKKGGKKKQGERIKKKMRAKKGDMEKNFKWRVFIEV